MVNSSISLKLATTLVEPLYKLEQHFLTHCQTIGEWFQHQWQLTPPPVYGSVDLRNAGFKLAPVDMNLFPAGFNNLNPNFLHLASLAAKEIIQTIAPDSKKVLIIPETHTRNLPYWNNIATLKTILEAADFSVRFGFFSSEHLEQNGFNAALPIPLAPLSRKGNVLQTADFVPDVILLNNDFSEGIPALLEDIDQPVLPPAELGWSQRLKSVHFQIYSQVVQDFAQAFKIDPWLIAPLFRHCHEVDFMQQAGLATLQAQASELFHEVESKYQMHGIPYQPFLIIKADAGTYGMAVMTLRNVEELKALNRKQRTRMASTKGRQPVKSVIIQEGIYSFETFGAQQSVAEPVVYLWGKHVVGGFYRVHHARGIDENLNAPGMQFEPIAFPQPCHEPCKDLGPDACQNRLYVYGIVAKLSMLAAAREIAQQKSRLMS